MLFQAFVIGKKQIASIKSSGGQMNRVWRAKGRTGSAQRGHFHPHGPVHWQNGKARPGLKGIFILFSKGWIPKAQWHNQAFHKS